MPRKAKAEAPLLRVWWVPQVPCKRFFVDVTSINQAKFLLVTLAEYDRFQLDNNIKPDYANAGGLEMFEDGEWVEWYNANGDDIDVLIRQDRMIIMANGHQP